MKNIIITSDSAADRVGSRIRQAVEETVQAASLAPCDPRLFVECLYVAVVYAAFYAIGESVIAEDRPECTQIWAQAMTCAAIRSQAN